MKMGKLEKLFVNNAGHSQSVVRHTEAMMCHITTQPGQTYLDMGCGNGAAAIYVAQTFDLKVTGVDVDGEQIGLSLPYHTWNSLLWCRTRKCKTSAGIAENGSNSILETISFEQHGFLPPTVQYWSSEGRVFRLVALLVCFANPSLGLMERHKYV